MNLVCQFTFHLVVLVVRNRGGACWLILCNQSHWWLAIILLGALLSSSAPVPILPALVVLGLLVPLIIYISIELPRPLDNLYISSATQTLEGKIFLLNLATRRSEHGPPTENGVLEVQ
jgi:hypothetical protein